MTPHCSILVLYLPSMLKSNRQNVKSNFRDMFLINKKPYTLNEKNMFSLWLFGEHNRRKWTQSKLHYSYATKQLFAELDPPFNSFVSLPLYIKANVQYSEYLHSIWHHIKKGSGARIISFWRLQLLITYFVSHHKYICFLDFFIIH